MDLIQQFTQLRLSGMKHCWETLVQTRKVGELSLKEGIELLLDSESQQRSQNRFERLIKSAKFRYQASIEELHFNPARGLDNALISELAVGNYLQQGQSIIITGATGCGKSFLASALGHQACFQGYKVKYFNLQKFLIKTKLAKADGSIIKLMDQISKSDLLILDDFGLSHLDKYQRIDLLEIIEDRHGKKSTIIASQIPPANWYDIIGDDTIADAILDRLIHTSYKIELRGESLRRNINNHSNKNL